MLHSSISENTKDTFSYDQKSKLTKEANLDEYNSVSSHFFLFCYYSLRQMFIQIVAYKEKRDYTKYIWNIDLKFSISDMFMQTIGLNLSCDMYVHV